MNNTLFFCGISLLHKINWRAHSCIKRISYASFVIYLFFRFNGCISSITYSVNGRPTREAYLKHAKGTKLGCSDPCSKTGKCKNGAVCRYTSTGVRCDCKGTRFEGTNCSEGRNENGNITFWGFFFSVFDVFNLIPFEWYLHYKLPFKSKIWFNSLRFPPLLTGLYLMMAFQTLFVL